MAKILILTFNAGGGHVAVAQSITGYLQKDHQVKTVFYEEIFKAIDPIGIITGRKYTITDLYNSFIRKKLNAISNVLSYLTYLSYPLLVYPCKLLMRSYLENNKPDLIVSVAPVLNGLIAQVAQEHNIPFFIVPTDLDIKWFSCYLPPLNSKLLFTIPFDDSALWQNVTREKLNPQFVKVTGFPVKETFLKEKDTSSIKKKFNVPDGKPVVLLLMGSQGSIATLNYYKQLCTFDMPIHLLVCLGKNESLRNSLEQILLTDGVTASIINYTDQIADLMAISDVCILKPGTVSVCEALYSNVPIICDNTSMSLFWERFNLDFIKQNQFGAVVTDYQQINPLLKEWLSNPDQLAAIKKNISLLDKLNFGNSINRIVNDLLKE